LELAGSDLKGGSKRRTAGTGSRPLSAREREVLGMLAEGLSGAAIAERLVLSPETVRTHVRNAMDKLGASTRSQAVALALEDGQIGDAGAAQPAAQRRAPAAPPSPPATTPSATLTALLSGVAALADVEAATTYFAQEGGWALRLGAHASSAPTPTPTPAHELTLGEGSIGRVALERRARLVSTPASDDHASSPMLVTPMVSAGRLAGILCLEVRPSRPTSRRELLLLEAFGNRLADVLAGGGDLAPALRSALQRFKASWTGTLEVP
jgi:DNA-binding CsgD family transcriptional regulator